MILFSLNLRFQVYLLSLWLNKAISYKIFLAHNARSSNGRTRPSGGWNLGSNPSWAAIDTIKFMNISCKLGYIIGVISFVLYLLVLFTLGANFIFGLPLIPILLLFPKLNDPNHVGMGGIYIWGISGIIGISIFPIGMFIISKILKIEASFHDIAYGFMLSLGFCLIAVVIITVLSNGNVVFH